MGSTSILESVTLGSIGCLFCLNQLQMLSAGVSASLTEMCGCLIILISLIMILKKAKGEFQGYSIVLGIIEIPFGIIMCISEEELFGKLMILYGIWALAKFIFKIIVMKKNRYLGLNFITIIYIFTAILGGVIIVCPSVTCIRPFLPHVIGIYLIGVLFMNYIDNNGYYLNSQNSNRI